MVTIKIGIDLDGLMNNSIQCWLEKYNLYYNDNLTVEDIHSWDISQYTKCSKEELFKLLDDELFNSMTPIPHSVEVTEELSKQHELFVVTATHHYDANVKIEWLLKHFPHIKAKNIIITHRKDLVNVDLLIDDGAHNITAFPNDTIVFDYAWNRDLGDTYKRATSWLEVRDIVNKLNYKGG